MRIACWQSPVRHPDPRQHLARLRAAASEAADAGARLLVTPEASLTGYQLGRQRMLDAAEPAGGPLCAAAAEIAAGCGIALAVGWPQASGDRIYNTVRLIDADGTALADYRKAHLYGELDGGVFTPGGRAVVQAELDGLTVGLLICYDVEFPEAVRAHALAGTALLLVPTALPRPWEFVADTLLPARALESQLFIAYANWAGSEGELAYCGGSRVVGPDGRVLAEAGTEPGLLLADLDPAAIGAARAATGYLRDRRPELYSSLVRGVAATRAT